jgi:hypothetical protein
MHNEKSSKIHLASPLTCCIHSELCSNGCHSRLAGILPNPSLPKRGKGRFYRNIFFQRIHIKGERYKDRFRSSRNDILLGIVRKFIYRTLYAIFWDHK